MEERTETHLIYAYKRNRRWRPGELSIGESWSEPIAACRHAQPDDELISLYDVRNDPDALVAEEARITCQECLAWLADEDHRLQLLDTTAWIRKHVSAADKNIRYVDIPVSDE